MIARLREQVRSEDLDPLVIEKLKGLAQKHQRSLQAELTRSHFPYGNVIMVDPEEEGGCAFISHYLHGTKRADTPVFEKYRYFLIKIWGDSRKL